MGGTPYFGERERGAAPRTREELTAAAWGGIVAEVTRLLRTGGFAESFPAQNCRDGPAITGCDAHHFYLALQAEHPSVTTPLTAELLPATIAALEVVEFLHHNVTKPQSITTHEWYGEHQHFGDFSRAVGRGEFTAKINDIFRRQGMVFELQADGRVARVFPPVLREALVSAEFTSEDVELNRLLETARQRFGGPDFHTRYDALRSLWDAFERLRTLEPPRRLPESADALIARVSTEPAIREMLESEMRKDLNSFGNGFFIRHARVDQATIDSSEMIDYLFHRLFSVIRLLLRSTGRGQ